MPKRSEEKSPVAEAVEAVKKVFEPAACGHVNKQHYNTDGKLQDLACTLPDGHIGDHQALCKKLSGEPQTDEKGRVVKSNYYEVDAIAYWNNAAGKAANPVTTEVMQTSLLQKDLIMQIMKEHPSLTVEQATAQAKADARWNAAALS
jgi:hypothetical protein